MIKRRYYVFITIILLITFVMSLCNSKTYGFDKQIPGQTEQPGKEGDVIDGNLLDDLDDFEPSKLGDEEAFTEKVGKVLGILNVIGSIFSVITIMLIGFKYMLGSVEDKASYKKVMIPWLIGAVLVFSVTTIPNILFNIGTSLSKDEIKIKPPTFLDVDNLVDM